MAKRVIEASAQNSIELKDGTDVILARSYRKPFLSKVVVRADFAAPIVIPEDQFPKSLRSRFLKQFPLLDTRKQIARNVVADLTDKVGDTVSSTMRVLPIYLFSNKRKNQITLAPDNVAITYEAYEGYTNLKTTLVSTLDALLAEFPDTQFKRLGLRYVDNIHLDEANPTEWKEYLDERLLGPFDIASDRNTISRSFHVVEFNYGDFNMRFQYGMFNEDHPEPIKRKTFTLDYDAYIAQLLDVQELLVYLDKFHTKLKLSFEEVISDKLRGLMEPIDG